jgi:glycosyltransferase involved in cell wall biosynthesis
MASRRVDRHRAGEEAVDGRWQLGAGLRRPRPWRVQMPEDRRTPLAKRERCPPGKAMEEHGGERVDVARGSFVAVDDALGRDVPKRRRCGDGEPRAADAVPARRLETVGEPPQHLDCALRVERRGGEGLFEHATADTPAAVGCVAGGRATARFARLRDAGCHEPMIAERRLDGNPQARASKLSPLAGRRPETRVPGGPTRVLRVIARMNIGGPARHVSMLSGRLSPERFQTLLVHGSLPPGEGSFEWLADTEGCRVKVLASLGPEVRPLADLKALVALMRVMRAYRPQIVHTHTAKAGVIGRLAAVVAVRPRPVIVHTYHGHVLEGYFGPVLSGVYRFLERRLAAVSDCLIGVSRATVADLVRLRVAKRSRFRVVPLGLDLARFLQPDRQAAGALRARHGIAPDDVLVAFVGRLVPIKRVDLVLRAIAAARHQIAAVRLIVVGDGPERGRLESLTRDLRLGDAVRFLGYLPDSSVAAAAADLAILASDNEGTPVALIEAAAAGRPAVATAVGGVPEVLVPGTGLLARAGDHAGLAAAVVRLAADAQLRAQMGMRAREHVRRTFAIERLLRDMEALYDELLAARPTEDPSGRRHNI